MIRSELRVRNVRRRDTPGVSKGRHYTERASHARLERGTWGNPVQITRKIAVFIAFRAFFSEHDKTCVATLIFVLQTKSFRAYSHDTRVNGEILFSKS